MTMPTDGSSVARVNGIELGYLVVGEGHSLILLHGGFGTVEMFGPNVELLAAGRQVIGVDSSRVGAPRRLIGRCASRQWPMTSRP